MKIEFSEYEDGDLFLHQKMKIIAQGKEKTIHVGPLYDCPEDAIIGRDLISCDEILSFMQLAYKTGKDGEEYIVENVPYED
jgi:hypothetical protein